ncbi:30S ribosomal protein S14 [Candidatus Gracilibacteria bacterium CG17_big_fil_post_rev_8_21_14_2_50_48_13]|nr:MAG: 30S ribosomal protein S14 [Candidatus Gracilibacteria bacterium CG17_big_fil_post_rev_8_21_14_2_50_48_13]
MKHPTRVYNRCRLCGRIGGYMRFFQMCRICVRERVANGDVVGFKKASW